MAYITVIINTSPQHIAAAFWATTVFEAYQTEFLDYVFIDLITSLMADFFQSSWWLPVGHHLVLIIRATGRDL